MPAVLVVTTDGVPGYRITSVMGQVVGSVARLSNAFTEGIRTMDGQLNPRRSHDLAQWRTDAVNAMVEQARVKGANAVIGMRFDNRLISTAWAEICAYGTAVKVHPHDQPQSAAGSKPGSGSPAAQPDGGPQAAAGSSPVPPAPPEPPALPPGEEVRARKSEAERERGPVPEPEPQPDEDSEPAQDPGSAKHAFPERGDDRPAKAGAVEAKAAPGDDAPEPSERVGPELRAEGDPDFPDTPTDPSLRMPD